MVIHQDSIYIGGSFSFLNSNGDEIENLAAFGMDSASRPWAPNPNGSVHQLLVANDTLYAAGEFTSIASEERNNLAAFDATGTLTPWSPKLGLLEISDSHDPSQTNVSALTVLDDTIYFAGSFNTVAGQERNYLAAVNRDGTLLPWNPNPTGAVNFIKGIGRTVYTSGSFTSLAGIDARHLAATIADGVLKNWHPEPDGPVMALSASATSDSIYAGGEFTALNGEETGHLVAIDPSGDVASWAPVVNGTVRAISLLEGTVYIGGDFTRAGDEQRQGLAAIHSDGTLIETWAPTARGSINTIAVAEDTVFVGGGFSMINDMERNFFAAIDMTGNLTKTDPVFRPTSHSLDEQYHSRGSRRLNELEVANDTVFACGHFHHVNDQPITFLTAFVPDDTIEPHNFGLRFYTAAKYNYSIVNTIALSDATLFAGGDLLSVGEMTERYLVAFDGAGYPIDWKPELTDVVRALLVHSGRLYAGGDFGIAILDMPGGSG